MEDRNIEHFESRLDKETYSKEDVAKMLHNEAGFTAQQTRKEFGETVSRADYDEISTSLTDVKAQLAPYKTAEFDATASGEFSKLNGVTDRYGDFKTLAGLSGGESQEEVLAKATEMKESGKYDFMFTQVDSGAAKQVAKTDKAPNKPIRGAFTPSIGGYNLFKKKNK